MRSAIAKPVPPRMSIIWLTSRIAASRSRAPSCALDSGEVIGKDRDDQASRTACSFSFTTSVDWGCGRMNGVIE